jgi:hypothetical protein
MMRQERWMANARARCVGRVRRRVRDESGCSISFLQSILIGDRSTPVGGANKSTTCVCKTGSDAKTSSGFLTAGGFSLETTRSFGCSPGARALRRSAMLGTADCSAQIPDRPGGCVPARGPLSKSFTRPRIGDRTCRSLIRRRVHLPEVGSTLMKGWIYSKIKGARAP